MESGKLKVESGKWKVESGKLKVESETLKLLKLLYMNTLVKNEIKANQDIGDLRITNVFFDRQLDMMIILLNNRQILQFSLSDFPRLKKASIEQLNNWRLIGGGLGIHWNDLDEDLSLHGF